jgi:hypothetical protein
LLTFSSSMLGYEALDGFFNTIELANAVERFLGDWRAGGGIDIEELAPDMGPTTGFKDAVAGAAPAFAPSAALSTIAAASGATVARRSAWSVSRASIASSSGSLSRAQPLRGAAELNTAVAGHLRDDPLQRGDVAGPVFGRRHGPDYLTVPDLGCCSTIG